MRAGIRPIIACLLLVSAAGAREEGPKLVGVDVQFARADMAFPRGSPCLATRVELAQGDVMPIDLGCASGQATLEGHRLELSLSSPPPDDVDLFFLLEAIAPNLGSAATPLVLVARHEVTPAGFDGCGTSREFAYAVQGEAGGNYAILDWFEFSHTQFVLPGDAILTLGNCDGANFPIVIELLTLRGR